MTNKKLSRKAFLLSENLDEDPGLEHEAYSGVGAFVSAAPMYKMDEAFSGARQEVKTAFHRLESILKQSVNSRQFYNALDEALTALHKARGHQQEYDRLNEISRAEEPQRRMQNNLGRF